MHQNPHQMEGIRDRDAEGQKHKALFPADSVRRKESLEKIILTNFDIFRAIPRHGKRKRGTRGLSGRKDHRASNKKGVVCFVYN